MGLDVSCVSIWNVALKFTPQALHPEASSVPGFCEGGHTTATITVAITIICTVNPLHTKIEGLKRSWRQVRGIAEEVGQGGVDPGQMERDLGFESCGFHIH